MSEEHPEIRRIAEILASPPTISDAQRRAMWAALWYAPRLNRMAHIGGIVQPMLALGPPPKAGGQA